MKTSFNFLITRKEGINFSKLSGDTNKRGSERKKDSRIIKESENKPRTDEKSKRKFDVALFQSVGIPHQAS